MYYIGASANADRVGRKERGGAVDEVDLEPGEYILRVDSGVTWLNAPESESLVELVLTNRYLTLLISRTTGWFKRSQRLDCYPLAQIKRVNGDAQVFARRIEDNCCLQVVFGKESLTFNFPSSLTLRVPKKWAVDIIEASDREYAAAQREASKRAEKMRAERERERQRRAEEERAAAKLTMGRCVGCHAPLSGMVGRIVKCAYCDTKQTL